MSIVFDDPMVVYGIGYSSRYRTQAMPESAVKISPRQARSSAYYGMYVSDSRPTKREGLQSLESMYDITSQLPKGGARGTLIHEFAYIGAAALIAIDPQDRFRD